MTIAYPHSSVSPRRSTATTTRPWSAARSQSSSSTESAFYAEAADPKELVVIDAADHLFDGRVSEVADAVEDLLADWPGHP